jgi:DNA polymerase
MSAAKILGMDVADFDRYKAEKGSHHPKRKLGKVAELASGYQGGLGAWRNFERSQGVDLGMDDEAIREAVRGWRAASPAIVEFWGGQFRRGVFQPYGCEGAAIEAVRNPGACYAAGRGGPVAFGCKDGVLYCRLPSGRCIVYQDARVYQSRDLYDRPIFKLIYRSWASKVPGGKKSWVDVSTYGGALVENICQAVARDLQAAALVRLERAGYPPVLHVHDEIVAEVREGVGDPEDFRRVMATLPDWAAGWPLRVGSAWRGKRFRK